MATKLYLHDAANALSGTFPTGEQSSVLPGAVSNYSVSGSGTLKTMNTTIGAGQTSAAASSNATTSQQCGFFRFFCSPALAAQTINRTGETVTLNLANAESNTNMNMAMGQFFCCYIWRPSTGSMVASLFDASTLDDNPAEPGAASSERVAVASDSLSGTGISVSAGDVIIFEVWSLHTQGMSTSYTGTFYYDGTTENTTENAVVSNHASFVSFSQNITFQSNKELAADAGSYTITGTTAALEHDRLLDAGAGAYTIGGQDAVLQKGLTLAAGAGTYSLSGIDAALEFDRQVIAAGGSYAINGQSASLEYDRQLEALAGSYAINGTDADLVKVGAKILDAGAGAYQLNGQDADLIIAGPEPEPTPSRGGIWKPRRIKRQTIEKRGRTLRELFEPVPPGPAALPTPEPVVAAAQAAQAVPMEQFAPDPAPLVEGLRSLRAARDALALAQALEEDDAEVLLLVN